MRLPALLIALVSVLALGGTVQASCVPTPLSQQIGGAYVIATGTVVAHESGDPRRLVFAVEAVHKGSPPERVTVIAGPDVGSGPPGTQVATSVDYPAAVGTRHTLYLSWDPPIYRTDACSGSHEGEPTAEELAVLGTPRAPVRVFETKGSVTDIDRGLAAGTIVLVLAATYLAFRAHAVRGPVASGPGASDPAG